MSETTAPTGSGSTKAATSEPVKVKAIDVDSNGNTSGDLMALFKGQDQPEVEDDEEVESGEPEVQIEEGGKEESAGEEGEEESEKEPSSESDLEASLDQASKEVKGKGVTLKLASGKEIKLPNDAVIMHKVDGVLTPIKLQDALNREAGELTVEQRMTKLAHYEHKLRTELEQEKKRSQSSLEDQQNFFRDVAALAQSDDPSAAIVKIAERTGISPGQAWKKIFQAGLRHAEMFKQRGLTMDAVEAHFDRIDREFFERKLKERDEAESKKGQTAKIEAERLEVIQEFGITPEEFDSVGQELLDSGELARENPDRLVRRVGEEALNRKKATLISEALKGLPTLANDLNLNRKIAAIIDPRDWTAEEIRELAVTYYKDSSGNQTPSQPRVKPKPNALNVAKSQSSKIKVIDAARDFRSAFGRR